MYRSLKAIRDVFPLWQASERYFSIEDLYMVFCSQKVSKINVSIGYEKITVMEDLLMDRFPEKTNNRSSVYKRPSKIF